MKACDKKKRIKDKCKWIAALSKSGMTAANAGRTEEAEVILIMALYVAKSTGFSCLEAKTLNNIGVFYACRKFWEHAFLYYEKALSIAYSEPNSSNHLCQTIQKNMMKVLRVH